MKTSRSKVMSALLSAGAVCLIALFATYSTSAQQTKGQAKGSSPTDFPGYIGGVVQGERGPEAGVWVIAETNDLQTKFVKIVVTDDQGRYMLPQLPTANYKVWVRGYGLVDSTPVMTKPVTTPLNLKATTAKTPQEAAKVYPGDYWLSLLQPPPASMFPGTGGQGNGLGQGMLTQQHWLNTLKSGCNFCHQLGNQLTRTLDDVYAGVDANRKAGLLDSKGNPEPVIKTSIEAWDRRLKGGVRGNSMYGTLNTMGSPETLKVFADWTDRIAKGEVPPAPPRPSGIERNIVVTMWDVGDDHSFMHDQIATDKQKPTVNAYGKVYAVSAGHGQLVELDPRENFTTSIDIPTREPRADVPSRFPPPTWPSLHWGNTHLWSGPEYDPADPHNPMIDSKGRVWTTSKIRGRDEPSWCMDPSNKYAAYAPLSRSGRQASFYDPKTQKWNLIETCYSTHHLQFDNDPDETVYFNELSGPIFGWVDSKIYDQTYAATHDEHKAEQAAVGWCAQTMDTNNDGKISPPFNQGVPAGVNTVEAVLYEGDTATGAAPKAAPAGRAGRGGRGGRGKAAPFNPKLDTVVRYAMYSVIPSPVDTAVWGIAETYPGFLVRMERGSNPPSTCKTRIFKVPSPGFDPRGVDIDKNGVVWTALAGSSDLASFDYRKCKDLATLKLDGSQCSEGWTLYQTPGPKLKGTNVPADFHYYNWVDQFNVVGLGANTPFLTGSNDDSLAALDPKTKKWTYFRVPYPLGFYSRGMDGRIDDASAGWKGRGLWSNYGTHFVWQIEGGKGTKGKIVHFQIRPNPLAR